jgi:hypothetical protein
MKFFRNIKIEIVTIFCLVFIFFLIGCAAEGMPSGGPKDEIGPSIISTFPKNGETNVNPDSDIIFEFSEVIDYKSVENSLTIFPSLTMSPRIKISKNIVKIRLAEKLQENTTYIFSFGRKVQDLQKNMTDGEVKIAFSTGEKLDKGTITGQLFDYKESKEAAYVLFYRNNEKELDTLIQRTPDYFVSVDKNGFYKATNLADGKYSIAAFVGNFKGKPRFTENSQTAVAFQDFITLTNSDSAIIANLRLGNYPLKNFEYLKAIQEEDAIHLNFSHPLNMKESNGFNVAVNGHSESQNCFYDAKEPNVMQLSIKDLDSSEHIIEIQGLVDVFDRVMKPAKDTIFWKTGEIVDTIGATVKIAFPATKDADITTNVLLEFSEPVEHPGNYSHRIGFLDKDSHNVEFDVEMISNREIKLSTKKDLIYGNQYRVLFLADSILDYNGNACLDSVKSFSFSTIDDNIFGMISGNVTSDFPYDNLMVCATLKDPKQPFAKTSVDLMGNYKFDQLIPGDYWIYIFYDENANETYDWGSLIPYQSSEHYKFFSKPVSVRSRWETERVDLTF